MKLYNIFFSPTGGTAKVCSILSHAFCLETINAEIKNVNDTFLALQPTSSDLALIAVPSFGGRVPAIVKDILVHINGNGCPAVLVSTFGNRDYDDTLAELKEIATNAGFNCIAAIAAGTQHSMMPQYGVGRPDEWDTQQLTAFAKQIKEKLQDSAMQPLDLPSHTPYKEYHGVPLKPSAHKECINCQVCAKTCPMNAIPMDEPYNVEKDKCITCMKCVAVCPTKVRTLNKLVLSAVALKMKKQFTERKENKLFL